jgi:hypothetical protein
MYRTYGTINAFRNCDISFTHGALVLLSVEGGVERMLRLFLFVDNAGDLCFRVTHVAGYPEVRFDKIRPFERTIFHWSDVEDVLSGMDPRKAARELSGKKLKEFLVLTDILAVFDRKERAARERRTTACLRPPRYVGAPRLFVVK